MFKSQPMQTRSLISLSLSSSIGPISVKQNHGKPWHHLPRGQLMNEVIHQSPVTVPSASLTQQKQ